MVIQKKEFKQFDVTTFLAKETRKFQFQFNYNEWPGGLVSVGAMGAIASKLSRRKVISDTIWGVRNTVTSKAQHPLFQILMRPLPMNSYLKATTSTH